MLKRLAIAVVFCLGAGVLLAAGAQADTPAAEKACPSLNGTYNMTLQGYEGIVPVNVLGRIVIDGKKATGTFYLIRLGEIAGPVDITASVKASNCAGEISVTGGHLLGGTLRLRFFSCQDGTLKIAGYSAGSGPGRLFSGDASQ